ncbi:hypothetical protein B0T14DRAFT_602962 [Immersiella caudata]|uniref:Uncharacterized protein n=1 Tax=Immersiella caudata TaxID=314043 RepID=A0AA39WPE9_9PEZI|nr:hypothetical protein B0T14DRAFT_602962 [Immersiella caudata]
MSTLLVKLFVREDIPAHRAINLPLQPAVIVFLVFMLARRTIHPPEAMIAFWLLGGSPSSLRWGLAQRMGIVARLCKAGEKSKSLHQQLFKISGRTLTPSSSFKTQQYSFVLSSRNQILGVFVRDGQLLPMALPRASTAFSEDPATVCLRAIVTGLLSLYDADATTAIITAFIPGTLARHPDERAEFDISPPVMAAFRDDIEGIEAVAVEEDNNLLRQLVLEHVT